MSCEVDGEGRDGVHGCRNTVLVIVVVVPDIMIDGLEEAFAKRTLRFHFRPLEKTGEAELVHTGVGVTSVHEFSEANCAFRGRRCRRRARWCSRAGRYFLLFQS
jgi:hypothetical protein